MKKTLVEKIKSKYSKDSQIKTVELGNGQSKITMFYIESLVDKNLFSSSLYFFINNLLKFLILLLSNDVIISIIPPSFSS